MSATIYVLLIAWQFGWLRSSGIGNLGNLKAWLIAELLISALLFESLHLLQAFTGRSLGIALIEALEATISGIWRGACAILWSTVWLMVAIHFGSNAFVLIKGLSYPGLVFSYQEYSIAIILQLPLIILSLHWIIKTAPRSVMPSIP